MKVVHELVTEPKYCQADLIKITKFCLFFESETHAKSAALIFFFPRNFSMQRATYLLFNVSLLSAKNDHFSRLVVVAAS